MCGFFIFDAFGSVTGIRYSGHHRIRTNVGGIMTITCIIVTIVTMIFYGDVYIKGSELSQVYNLEKFWNSQNITITDKFKFAIANRFNGKIDLRQDIFSMSASHIKYNIENFEVIETKLKNYSCKKEDWAMVEKQFDQLGLENALCFDVDGLELSGNRNADWFNYFRVKYTLNLSNDDEDWNSYIENIINDTDSTAMVYFLEGIFQMSGKQSAINYFVNSVPLNITFTDIKELRLSISEDQLIIKKDKVLITTEETSSAFVVDEIRDSSSYRSKFDRNCLTVDLVSSRKRNNVIVSFLSFSELLARIGGIVQNLVTIFFLFNYVRNYWSYEIAQYNTLFERIENDYSLKNALVPVRQKIRKFIKEKGYNGLENQDNNYNKHIFPSSPIVDRLQDKNNDSNYNLNKTNYFNLSIIDNSNPRQNEKYYNETGEPLAILKRINVSNINNNNKNNNNLSSLSKLNNNKEETYNVDAKDYQDQDYSSVSRLQMKYQNSKPESEEGIIKEAQQSNLVLDINKLGKKDKELTENKKYESTPVFKSQMKGELDYKKSRLLKIIQSIASPLRLQITDNGFYEELINFKRSSTKNKFELDFSEYVYNKYLSFFTKSICNGICSNAKGKTKSFGYLDEYMNRSLEMKNYERNFFQINMLKYMLLSEEQMKAFEKIPLFNGYEIIKQQIDYNNSDKLDYNFGFDSDSIQGLTETDQKLHSMFVGFN